ncbi:MAG: hypothetical protein KGH75_11250, partial [Rhodospirillales bacterium]|nr:hypothetical protein [Rhodospirillales bacterium]
SFAGANEMSSVVLSLGDVAFRDMEVPEKISFGGKQRLAVQNIIGGGRIVEALGIDDGEISFSGIFSGSDAASRAQLLDTARVLGAQLPLVWQGFYYLVVIAGFSAEYHKPNLIPFTITCVVVTDPLSASANAVAPVANLISGDLAAASALSGQAGVSAMGLAGASLATLGVVQGEISGAMAASGSALTGAASTLNSAVTPTIGIAALGRLGSCTARLAGLSGMSGYVNRAATNLGLELP